ncbi:MAG: hypothetical protein HY815_26205 [Candidatus Riflebacteria bacterium]|nr:hypothetical protein [Candidatus Riflebacteria bacterium]
MDAAAPLSHDPPPAPPAATGRQPPGWTTRVVVLGLIGTVLIGLVTRLINAPPGLPIGDRRLVSLVRQAERGQLDEAARGLFAFACAENIRSLPPGDPKAGDLEWALVKLLEIALASPPPLSAPLWSPAGPCATGGDSILRNLSGFLATGRFAEAAALVDCVSRSVAPPELTGDATCLGPGNGLVFLGALAALHAARDEAALFVSLRRLQLCRVAHPAHPTGLWSGLILSDILLAAELKRSGEIFAVERFDPSTAPRKAEFPLMGARVEHGRERTRREWFQTPRARLAPLSLRRALLVSQIVVEIHRADLFDRGIVRPDADAPTLTTRLSRADPALAREVGPLLKRGVLGFDSPLARRQLLGVAAALGMPRSELVLRVEADAAVAP